MSTRRACEISTTSRWRVEGREAAERAIAGGEPVQCLVVAEGCLAPELEELCRRAEAAGIAVERAAPRRRQRVGGAADVVGFVGPDPHADLDTVMARGGAVWLLVGAAYPGNVGAAIRTAEVSGADAVYIDNAFDHTQRREARRTSMRADRIFPVAWEATGRVIGAARRAGKLIVGVEDSGGQGPWETDLGGPTLFIAGGEAHGIPASVLRRCDRIARIPMAGCIVSYNLQAAVAVLAVERLRQLQERGA